MADVKIHCLESVAQDAGDATTFVEPYDPDGEARLVLLRQSILAEVEEKLALLQTVECDEPLLCKLAERSTTCAICHDEMCVGETLRQLPCEHAYHATCLGHWLRIKAACPLCNAKVRPATTKATGR